MIRLTKLNGEAFAVNCDHIVTVDSIPDSKVTLVNKEFFIVRESMDEIIDKIKEYTKEIHGI